MFKFFCWTWVVLLVVGFIGIVAAAPPGPPTCRSDWTKCADNADMANNYKDWLDARVNCMMQANDQARYGTPEWPSRYFSNFYPGTGYTAGVAILVEPKAKFQNGFGAMVHSQVTCLYDLRNKKVVKVDIS